ncbi:MAG: type II toxin-antitoxin system VapC family toxin [Acidobacteria bacterium]|nr:type II toxin-antitoxin system VapC family toxin [Acidobacteriota bacterium]
MAYFDTAYLVKCYVKEEGWDSVRALAAERGRVACSVFGRLELHAALHRTFREGRLTRRELEAVLDQLSADEAVRMWHWLPLSAAMMTAVVDVFGQLPPGVFLRTGDAVHLMTARDSGFREVFSNDRRLLAAARHVGITGVDVIGRRQ